MVSKSEGKELWRYVWDYENRLTIASTRKQTIRYRYDALGRRVQRYFVGGKENAKFIYDGLDVVADDNNGVLTKYQNGLGIDNKLKMTTSGTAKYFLADHLGSTVGLTDASGNVSSSASYDSFGNSTNNLNTRYQFTGREFDNFTGLYFYRARWYDTNLGRFISEDPIGFAGGDVNLYGYVKNKSLSRRDPMGLDDADIAFRETEYYKQLEKRGKEFWDSVRNLPRKPECGPSGSPFLEAIVPDSVGGSYTGPFGSAYKITPACETHDSCYSTCGTSQEQCDSQFREDVKNICLQGGGSESACSFYGWGYYQGVSKGGNSAYKSAQEQSRCFACLPTSPPPRDPCSKFGDWRCK